MTERARGRYERRPDFFGKNRHQQAEASRLKISDRSDHGDDLYDPAAASCPTSRKRQRSRSRERARTGLWGDGQEQLSGRNGMIVASNRSSPLDPLPETPRSCCSSPPRALTPPSPPSKPTGESGDASSSSHRPCLIEQEEEVARELGHRQAFQSWRGHDENLLSLMDEVMYDDDVLLVEKNDTHSSPDDWRLAIERFRATGRASGSSNDQDVEQEEEEEGNDSEVWYVPCNPVADRVPIAIDEEVEDDRDERQEDP